MQLIIKTIINGLFEAKISYGKFEITAIGQTRDEATKNALHWLKRELEMLPQTNKDRLEKSQDLELETLTKELDEKQPLYILKGEEWKRREKEIQLMAHESSKIAIKAAVGYGVRASIGGAVGLIF